MLTELVPTALANRLVFNGIMLMACRNILQKTPQFDVQRLALYYKLCSLQSLRETLSELHENVQDFSIVQAAILASDEV